MPTISVRHPDHSYTDHEGTAAPCPRCQRAPIFDVRCSASWQPLPWECNAFCGGEDRLGIVDVGVRQVAMSETAAIQAAIVAWRDHDHVIFRDDVDRVIRQSDLPRQQSRD